MNGIHSRHGSLGHVVIGRLVARTPPAERRLYDRAFQTAAYALDCCAGPDASLRKPEMGNGVGVLDNVKPGETLVIYADAHPKAGYRITNCTTAVLVECFARAATLNEGKRHRRRIELAFLLYPQDGESTPGADRQAELALMQTNLIEFAAHTISIAALRDILSINDGVPVLSIVCKTSNRGGRRATAKYHASRLPGDWLGTTPSAGQA